MNLRFLLLLLTTFSLQTSLAKGLFHKYTYPAKKIKDDKAYVLFGLEFDKSFDQKGAITDNPKKMPFMYAMFSSCPLDQIKEMYQSKDRRTFHKKWKEQRSCHLETGNGNRYRLNKNQKYYLYELPLRDSLVFTGFSIAMFAKKVNSKSFKLEQSYKLSKKAAKKAAKKMQGTLRGRRFSHLMPLSIERSQKILPGQVYYIGDFIYTLGDRSFIALENKKIFKEYIPFLVPEKLTFSNDIKQAETWLKKSFKYKGDLKPMSGKNYKNIIKSQSERQLSSSDSNYMNSGRTAVITNRILEHAFEIPVEENP